MKQIIYLCGSPKQIDMEATKEKLLKEEVMINISFRGRLTDELACFLLRPKALSKEEILFSSLITGIDDEQMIRFSESGRDTICEQIGISRGTFNNYLSSWRKAGIVRTSGDYIIFTCGFKKDMKAIFIGKNLNVEQ